MLWNRFFQGPLMAAAPVLPGGGDPPAADAPPAAAPAGPTQAEFDALKAQIAEKDQGIKFWYDKATAKGAPAPAPAADPAEEADLLEMITTGGPKAFDKWMKKQGYVSREELDATVNSKAAQLSKEQELVGRYPDLKKHDSDFFKATALHYGDLKKSGVPEAMAMELAAERAELEGIRTGKLKTPAQRTEEEKAAAALERKNRALAQASDRGGRAPEGSEEDDELTPEQRQIAIKMLAGDGVTEEQAIAKYKARAKQGVRVSTRAGR